MSGMFGGLPPVCPTAAWCSTCRAVRIRVRQQLHGRPVPAAQGGRAAGRVPYSGRSSRT